MNREAIYAALFDLAATAPGLVTWSRKLLHWSDVPASQRPALFMSQGSQTAIQKTGMPTVWMLEADLHIYVSTQGSVSPGEVLNPIVDAIAGALDYQYPGIVQTLGGLVQWARIEGTIETFEGTLGNDEICLIPIRMLVS